jgi:phosphomannomutase
VRLFGTSGIRGIYPKEVTPELMLKLGLTLASYLGGRGDFLVGGDCRLTTQVLKMTLTSGLIAGGVNVFDAGLIPLPVLTYGIVKHSLSGGAYVTASHNPPEHNGVKIFDRRGLELSSEDEEVIEGLVSEGRFKYVDWSSVGRYSELPGLIDEYLEDLSSRLTPKESRKKVRVVVDTANCATSLVTPKLLTNLGCEVITLNSSIDGRFPGREPEPRPDILQPYLRFVKELNVDLFLAHDGDGDRLAVIEPTEGFIKQDRLIALMFKYKLMERPGKVVASIDCGNAVKEVVRRFNGELIISKLGKIHETLVKSNALIAAEPWKLIDPSWGYWIDSIYQAGLIVKIMIEEGKTLRELLSDIPNYPQARYSIRVPQEVKLGLYQYLRDYLMSNLPSNAEVLSIDGLRVDYEDSSWVLVRPSGTEAKVRIYAEAKDLSRLKELVNNLLNVCREYLKVRGIELSFDGALIP